jgi:hypothetical protein
MALMGGLALSVWNHVRSTQDVDILLGIGSMAPERILDVVSKSGFRPRRKPPVTQLGSLRVLQLEFDPEEAYVSVHVDLLLSNSEYHDLALARRVWRKIPQSGHDVPVLRCEDLVLHKLLAGRLIDLADGVALLKANGHTLDFDYLEAWAARLDVAADLERIRREAARPE